MKTATGKVVAGSFALAAFAVGVVSGLASDNPAAQILLHALLAMLACYPVGLIVGLICERVITLHLQTHARANPGPDSNAAAARGENGKNGDEEVIVI